MSRRVLDALEADLDESFIRSGGKGGQNVNKVASCGVLVHRPSGTMVTACAAGTNAIGEAAEVIRRGAATAMLAGKLLELVREIRPKTRNVAVLANAADPFAPTLVGQIEAAGKILGIAVRTASVRGKEEYEAEFTKF